MVGGFARAARRAAAGFALAIAAMTGAALAASPAGASVHDLPIYPVVECVSPISGGYVAVFGYNNETGATQTLPIGTNNNFLPTPQNRGQPTTFKAGRVYSVFSASWTTSTSSYLYWDLQNTNGALANSSSPKCSSDPVPIWGPQTLLWLVALAVTALGVRTVGRRRRLALPPG